MIDNSKYSLKVHFVYAQRILILSAISSILSNEAL